MFKQAAAILALGVGIAGTAQATEIVGGFVDLSYGSLTDGDGSRFGVTGSSEYSVGEAFNIQVTGSADRFTEADKLHGDFSVHGIYTPLETVSLGGFLGYDGFDGHDSVFAGLEGRLDLGNLMTQGYYQIGEADDVEFRSWGTSAIYTVSPGVGVGAFYDDVELPGAVDLNRYGLSFDYTINNQYGLFARIGGVETSASGGANETNHGFVEIGARVLVGGNGRTTFDKRTVFGIAPGG